MTNLKQNCPKRKADAVDCFCNDSIVLEIRLGILRGQFRPRSVVDIPEARQICIARQQLLKDRKMPMLTDISELRLITKAARDFLASAEGMQNITASAIVTGNQLFSQTQGNIMIKLSKSEIPQRNFTHAASALWWLRRFRQKEL